MLATKRAGAAEQAVVAVDRQHDHDRIGARKMLGLAGRAVALPAGLRDVGRRAAIRAEAMPRMPVQQRLGLGERRRDARAPTRPCTAIERRSVTKRSGAAPSAPSVASGSSAMPKRPARPASPRNTLSAVGASARASSGANSGSAPFAALLQHDQFAADRERAAALRRASQRRQKRRRRCAVRRRAPSNAVGVAEHAASARDRERHGGTPAGQGANSHAQRVRSRQASCVQASQIFLRSGVHEAVAAPRGRRRAAAPTPQTGFGQAASLRRAMTCTCSCGTALPSAATLSLSHSVTALQRARDARRSRSSVAPARPRRDR